MGSNKWIKGNHWILRTSIQKLGMILQQGILNFRNKVIVDGDKSSSNW